MKRSMALTLSGVLAACGLALLTLAVASGTFSPDGRRFVVVLTLFACALLVGIIGGMATRRAEADYTSVVRTATILLVSGLMCLTAFFGLMASLLGAYPYRVLLAVMMTCYGVTLLMVAGANLYLSQKDYRVFYFDLARQLPSMYYRYRT